MTDTGAVLPWLVIRQDEGGNRYRVGRYATRAEAERVADRLLGLQETLGLDGILCEMNCGTKIPHARVMKSLQLLCEKVKPRVH